MDKYAIKEMMQKEEGKVYCFPLGVEAENVETDQNRQFVSEEEKEKIGEIDGIKRAFTDGCNTIVAGCTTYGATPASNSPSDIVDAIGLIYQNRYNTGYSAGYGKGLEDGVDQMAVKTGNYTWTFSGNKYNQGGKYLNIIGPDNSLSYDTGEAHLIACAITETENLYFFGYDEANKNYFAPGQVTTSVDASGKIYINVPSGMRITNYHGTGEEDYGTTTITVTYYYY